MLRTLALLGASLTLLAGVEPVSTGSLLREMTSPDHLAAWPEPAYQTLQASSYDRASKAPGQPGWFANADWSHFIREERHGARVEQVMMEDRGPGAIVRLWCTWFGPMDGKLNHCTDGLLRIYLDGGAEPVIAGTLSELLVKQGLAGAPFAETTPATAPPDKRAYNLYLPIPYATGCKVTYETKGKLSTVWNQGEALYYQINYRKYPAGTAVRSFANTDLGRLSEMVGRTLAEPPSPPPAVGQPVTLKPGETKTLKFKGPLAIATLACGFDQPPSPELLDGIELSLVFDGVACVRMPVGSFFGTGSRFATFKTRLLEASAGHQLRCRWMMPFAREAVVGFTNTTRAPVALTPAVATGGWKWNDRSMHFHASRAPLSGIRVAPGERGARDVNFVTVAGRGRLVGDSLFITNQPDPRKGDSWWGEGDEKIYIDGESFPSHFGTGTEDYYGYAHCRPEAFSSPFHAQPYGDGNLTPGDTPATRSSLNTRIRLLDDIPFAKALKFDMELWHWQAARMDFIPTTYYYLTP